MNGRYIVYRKIDCYGGIMQTAIIAGCFAFLGAVIGQLLSRNTQKETWLLQKRAETFSKFYIDLENYETEVFRIDDSGIDENNGMKMKMYVLESLFTSASIVRLYLSSKNREKFMEYLINFVHFKYGDMSTLEKTKIEFKKRDNLKQDIINIFESNLEKIKWY